MNNTNPRKLVAETVAALMLEGGDSMEKRSLGVISVERDPRNPYALVARIGEKQFRVIVKEL